MLASRLCIEGQFKRKLGGLLALSTSLLSLPLHVLPPTLHESSITKVEVSFVEVLLSWLACDR
eukprot:5542849-Amphidinium_carterae.1